MADQAKMPEPSGMAASSTINLGLCTLAEGPVPKRKKQAGTTSAYLAKSSAVNLGGILTTDSLSVYWMDNSLHILAKLTLLYKTG